MSGFSCVVIGDESLLIGCSDALLERGHVIRAVVSNDPAIRDWATGKGLMLLEQPADLVVCGEFDWLFSIANLSLIPDEILARATRGAINFHDGPLPRHAGLNAPVWALLAGDTEFGVTWHMLEGGIDEGDIVEQRLFEIAEGETAFSLNAKCYAAAMESFGPLIAQLEAGEPARRPQDLSQRSYHARDDRPVAMGRVDFQLPSETLCAQIRALDFGGYWNPLTCAKISTGDTVLLIGEAEPADATGAPGTVISAHCDGLVVATGDGAIRLGKVRDAFGNPVDAEVLVQSGAVLPQIGVHEAAALEAGIRATLREEMHWRAALRAMRPVAVPLARTTGESGIVTRDIAAPASLSTASRLAAILAWALRGSDDEIADIALTHAGLCAGPAGYVCDWVPVQARADQGFAALAAELDVELPRLQTTRGFACDLAARDPGTAGFEQPAIAVSLDQDAPVTGSALTVCLNGDGLRLHGDAALLDDSCMDLLSARLDTVLQAVAEGSDKVLSDLPALPEAERELLLNTWNDTARDYDADLTIYAAFEAQVARTPQATALVFEDTEFTYAELNARANAVASKLSAMGVKPGTHVGLYVTRSPDLVIGALAILKAGGAYVPLDPAYPADRIAHYVRDSQAQVIVTLPALEVSLPQSEAQVLVLSGEEKSDTAVDGGAAGGDLAYLIYTSGSTGLPKGVMVSHRNVANFFAGMDDCIPHRPGDSWLALTSLSFDISVLELFWTLSRGLKLVLGSDENRLVMSQGPIAMSDRTMDFSLYYWGNDDGPGPRKYQMLLDGARFAQANGFCALWTPERHFHAFGGPYPNPSVTGAAIAAVAPNISVRAGSVVAPLHHPARIAEEWSVIDNLTNGGAGLAFASGWQPDDFVLRPENTPPDNKPAMYDAIDKVRRLWRGEAVEFPRKDGDMHAVITQPRPVSEELPFWVTIAGNPDTWREAGEIGANVLTHLLGQSIEEVGEKIKIYHAALRGAGHDPEDFTVTLMLHTFVADSRDTAREKARGPMKDYLSSAAGLIKQSAWDFPAFKRPKGVSNPFQLDLSTLSADEVDAILEFAFERYFNESGLFGTVEDCLARVESLKQIGIGEIACLIDYGIDRDEVLDGLKPLAEVLRLSNATGELEPDDFSLAAQIIRHEVTHMQCTPSMARLITSDDTARKAMNKLRHVLVGGEALPGELVAELRDCGKATLHNMYGPTETTVWSTRQIHEAAPEGIADVGRPIANTTVYVLDSAGNPVPVGVSGELFIGGDGVAAGYWQRADLTAERFVSDPFAGGEAKMYATGDLVRWRSDGRLDFLGRSDHQVKIRGQRIELGEIETAMTGFDGVRSAVVIPKTGVSGDERLVGFILADKAVSEPALRDYLSRHLTEVMVPAHIVTLDAFPLTPNKKIDRKALPDPQPSRAADAAPSAPSGSTEARVAEIWARTLGVGHIRGEDNFFTLGGHSLLAVQVHRELRDAMDVARLSITDIFRFPQLSALTSHLDKMMGAGRAEDQPEAGEESPARSETMSKRRAMRAGRRARTG